MRHVIVISVDALIESDLAVAKNLPVFGKLLRNADVVRQVMAVYPSYTYPCHATIMTGCYPEKHGIIHNEKFPSREWCWYAKDLKAVTMTTVAKEAGLSTCSVAWPVMGGADVDYLVGEIWAPKPEDDPLPWFDSVDSLSVKEYVRQSARFLDWMRTPGFDLFAADVFSSIFRDHAPSLSFLHLSYLDHQRHKKGSATEKVSEALSFIDTQLGRVVDAVEDAGLSDETVFVLLGDHGHRDVHTIFFINTLLHQWGYGGRIMVQSTSFSAYVYLQGIREEEAAAVLLHLQTAYPAIVEAVRTRAQVKARYHLDGAFSFVLEAADGVVFDDRESTVLFGAPDPKDWRTSFSTHGFAPEKGPFSPFIISGKGVSSGRIVEHCNLVDEAPTIMKLLGLEFPCDGKAINFS